MIMNGFTLVELSIVLVIIGLLIGGILVGQSLIESAKINSTAQQIQQFDAGVMAFKSRYKGLPGDSIYFGGDGDGYIDKDNTSIYVDSFCIESAKFFPSMDIKTYPGINSCTANVKGSSKNIPLAKMGKSGTMVIASAKAASNATYAAAAKPENYYAYITAITSQFTTTTSANSAFKPIELQSLDSKIDDGVANLGYVLSGDINNALGLGHGGIYNSPLATCSTGATYDLTQTGYECTPIIRIGASAGNPL